MVQFSVALSAALPRSRLKRLVRKLVALFSSPDFTRFMVALDDSVGEQRAVTMMKVGLSGSVGASSLTGVPRSG